VCASIEYHLGLADQASIDKDALEIQTAERGHRTRLTIRIQTGEFMLARETDHAGARQCTQLFQIDEQVSRKNGQNRLIIDETHDNLRP
jgi:hypothetical protein